MRNELARLAPKHPAPRTERGVDAYEARYMVGDGKVLWRGKSKAPASVHAIFLASALLTVPTFFIPGAAIGGAIGLSLMAAFWLFLALLRVTVSEGHVHVQYGLIGPKIPIGAIEAVEVRTYHWTDFGGWGIRQTLSGEWTYTMPGDGGRAVRIVWRDRKGARTITWIGSSQATELAEAIERARRTSGVVEPMALPPP